MKKAEEAEEDKMTTSGNVLRHSRCEQQNLVKYRLFHFSQVEVSFSAPKEGWTDGVPCYTRWGRLRTPLCFLVSAVFFFVKLASSVTKCQVMEKLQFSGANGIDPTDNPPWPSKLHGLFSSHRGNCARRRDDLDTMSTPQTSIKPPKNKKEKKHRSCLH